MVLVDSAGFHLDAYKPAAPLLSSLCALWVNFVPRNPDYLLYDLQSPASDDVAGRPERHLLAGKCHFACGGAFGGDTE